MSESVTLLPLTLPPRHRFPGRLCQILCQTLRLASRRFPPQTFLTHRSLASRHPSRLGAAQVPKTGDSRRDLPCVSARTYREEPSSQISVKTLRACLSLLTASAVFLTNNLFILCRSHRLWQISLAVRQSMPLQATPAPVFPALVPILVSNPSRPTSLPPRAANPLANHL